MPPRIPMFQLHVGYIPVTYTMPKTAHTTNLVDFVYINPNAPHAQLAATGNLGDIAVTILQVMGLEKPADMTAKSLIVKK